MYNSIQCFAENIIKRSGKILENIFNGTSSAVDLTQAIMEELNTLGCNLLAEAYETIDQMLIESPVRLKKWTIEKRNQEKTILDVPGVIRYKRTIFKNRETGEYCYLTDELLKLTPHQKVSLNVEANILKNVTKQSYEQSGAIASMTDKASKQLVKRVVHDMTVFSSNKLPIQKKKVKSLYIAADEDHVSAQFNNKKGDLKCNDYGRKINTLMPKLIVLYEGIQKESSNNALRPRYKLTGKHIFSGIYKGGKKNTEFWEEVNDYIESHYDTDELENVYISGDGAAWIKKGLQVIDKSKFVLDGFHMVKYINTATAHLGEDATLYKNRIWNSIYTLSRKELKNTFEELLSKTLEIKPQKYDAVEDSFKYLKTNWKGIITRIKEKNKCGTCCAEGLVSHILSERLSSRPMGWSKQGCDNMAKLIAATLNGEDMLELLRLNVKKKLQEEHEEIRKDLAKKYKIKQQLAKEPVMIPGTEKVSRKYMFKIVNNAIIF